MEASDIQVVYQDHYLLALNKPAGIVIHPTYKHSGDTLWDALLTFWRQQPSDGWHPPVLPDDPAWRAAPLEVQQMLRRQRTERFWKEEGTLARPCLLHRLDKDTSGIVALARTERSRRHFIRQFEEHTIKKNYIAVVKPGAYPWARPRTSLSLTRIDGDKYKEIAPDPAYLFSATSQDRFVLSGPLGRDPDDRRRCIVLAGGQEASTTFRVLSVDGAYALLAVQPVTGRTHQIRAHLAALGCAIVGDPVYAPASENGTLGTSLARQFLHAHSLVLRDYPTNTPRVLVAPLALDLQTWLADVSPVLLATMKQSFENAPHM